MDTFHIRFSFYIAFILEIAKTASLSSLVSSFGKTCNELPRSLLNFKLAQAFKKITH